MNGFWQDWRFGLRMLLKRPGFTFVAALTLAIGIGANTAIFSLLDKLLLRTLPVKDAEQLVLITAESVNPKFLNNIFSYPDFNDYRDRSQELSGLFAFIQVQTKFGTVDDAPNLRTELVSGNYFDALGVTAANGRAIGMEDEKEEGAHPVAVLSHAAWQRRFGSAPNIVGQQIQLNGVKLTVIGVAPREFAGMKLENPTEVWVPLMMRRDLLEATGSIRERRLSWLMLAGRLKPGVPLEHARAGLDLLARNIRDANTSPEQRNVPFYEKRMLMEPGGRGISYLRKNLDQPLMLLMAIVGLLLLIACANVANLLMARATTRHREIAVRLALGASRWQIVRQLLVESWLLAGIGAVAGMLSAPWLYELPLLFQPNLAVTQTVFESSLDRRVLAFTLLLTALTGTISGLAPAWQSARFDLVPALKDADANLHSRERRFNVRNLLVVGQIALSLVMVIGAGLLVRSLQRLLAVDTGFRAENVLVVPVELPREKFNGVGSREEFLRGQDEKNNAFFR
ncbi:MAG TPA: ABC transporter permease, partial [Blastocatellia bacterium]|nr:ABC transporter permease [Blastocatellia bacterium]